MQSLEMTIISGENLSLGKKPVKKNAFVVVRTDTNNEDRKTKMPVEGCSVLTWNEKLSSMELPSRSGYVSVEVHYKTSSGKTKPVGSVRVPVSDFLGGFVPASHVQFLSYRLKDTEGERNGIINISVRVKGAPVAPPPNRYSGNSVALCPGFRNPVTEVGIPVGGRQRCGGVVTGVPAAWYSHPQPCTY